MLERRIDLVRAPSTPPPKRCAPASPSAIGAGPRTDGDRALRALNAGGLGSWWSDLRSDTGFGDDRAARLFGLPATSDGWPMETVLDCIHPEDRGIVDEAVRRCIEGRGPYTAEYRVDHGDAGPRWVAARGDAVERDADGRPVVIAGVIWDAEAEARAREGRAILQREMDHRVKNAFSVLNALVGIGARQAPDIGAFASRLTAQIASLAHAHDVSTRLARIDEDSMSRVSACDILRDVLDAWSLATEPDLQTEGDLSLPPRQASALAMLLHELATNASKYGALCGTGGTLSVRLTAHVDGGATLDWSERLAEPIRGVRPEESGPGFGSVLISHCLGALEARMDRDLRADGLDLHIEIAPPRD